MRRTVLGQRLKAQRESAGMTLEDAAKVLSVAPLTVRRMEKAEVGLKLPYVDALLRAYGAGPQEIAEYLELAEEARQPGWWDSYRDVLPDWFTTYVSQEDAASLIRLYEPHYVTGLLQTPAYARAVLRAGFPNEPEQVLQRHVELRLRRQELVRSAEAPTLWIATEEAVLHRTVGGPEVMREQIDLLLEAAELPNVNLDIVPFSAGAHVGAYAPFTYFRFQEPELPDVVYTETLSVSKYFGGRADVSAHLEAHNRMSLLATAVDSVAFLKRMRKEYA